MDFWGKLRESRLLESRLLVDDTLIPVPHFVYTIRGFISPSSFADRASFLSALGTSLSLSLSRWRTMNVFAYLLCLLIRLLDKVIAVWDAVRRIAGINNAAESGAEIVEKKQT